MQPPRQPARHVGPTSALSAVRPMGAPKARRTNRRVLVVDDDDGIRGLLGATLEQEGYEVVTAPHGDAALREARARPPDAIITDVCMPCLDGPGLLTALERTGLGSVPVIVTSAQHCPEALRATAFISKPFDLDTITATLRRCIDASRRTRPLHAASATSASTRSN